MPKAYMVCYETMEEAQQAVELMEGTYVDGKPIQVTYDDFEECLEDGHFKVNVQGVSPYTDAAAVKAHMEKVGKVTSFRAGKEWRFGEVRFEDAEDAWQARIQMDGTTLMGKRIRTELDCSTESLSTVLVHGLQKRAFWQDLKDHFRTFGVVKWATIHGGPRSARIVFEDSEDARKAVRDFNKFNIKGQKSKIYVAFAYDGVGMHTGEDGRLEARPSVVRVQNVESWTTEDQLHQLFSKAGKVLSVNKEDPASILPPEFMST